MPKFQYFVLDLTKVEPGQTEPDPSLRIILEVMKRVQLARDSAEVLADFIVWLSHQDYMALPESLRRLVLYYVFATNQTLDLRPILPQIIHNEQFTNETMSLTDTLIAQGREEGREELAENRAKTKVIFDIGVIQALLGVPRADAEKLLDCTKEELKTQFQQLEAEYRRRFKAE